MLALTVSISTAVVTFPAMRLLLDHLAIPKGQSILWWPLTAAVVVVLVRCPRSWWAIIIVGYSAGQIVASITDNTWSLSLTYVLVNAIEVVVASLVLTGGRDTSVRRLHAPRDAVRFGAASLMAVAVGIGVITASSALFPADAPFYDVLGGYAVPHLLGFLALAPLLLPGALGWRWTWLSSIEFALIVIAIGVIYWWSFTHVGVSGRGFLLLVPVIWAAVRLDSIRATATTVLVCILAAYATAQNRGPFAAPDVKFERSLLLALFLLTVAAVATGLILVTRHRLQLAKQASDGEQTLRVAIRDALIGVYSIHLDPPRRGQIRDVNTALCTLLGYLPQELIGQYCGMLGARSTASSQDRLARYLREFASGERVTLREESTFYTATGEQRWVELNLSAVNSVGEPKFVLAQVHDLTERERGKQELERMALRDSLTQLANRTLLFQRVNEELDAARADGSAIGMLFLDLDGFKEVNDTHGHAAGDAVLVAVAGRLTGAVRSGSTVARLGGDEFAIVSPHTRSVDELQEIAARLRRLIQEPIGLADGTLVSIDVSIGTALADGSQSADTLILDADRDMYRVKDTRRVS